MQLLRWIKRTGLNTVWLITAMLVSASVAAVEVRLTATFKSTSFRPGHDQFVDTSKPGGFCFDWPSLCAIYGVRTADIPITFTRTVKNGTGNHDEGFLVKVPAQRVVSVTNDQGASFPLTLRFTHFGHEIQVVSSTGSYKVPTHTAYQYGD